MTRIAELLTQKGFSGIIRPAGDWGSDLSINDGETWWAADVGTTVPEDAGQFHGLWLTDYFFILCKGDDCWFIPAKALRKQWRLKDAWRRRLPTTSQTTRPKKA